MSLDIDATRLSLLLNDLRLPAIKQIWSSFAERSDTEGWPAARLLMALAEHEIAERDRLRVERHLGRQAPAGQDTGELRFRRGANGVARARLGALRWRWLVA